MPGLTIPDEYVAGLTKIVGLSPEDGQRTALALANAKSAKSRELTELVAAALPAVSIRDAREIVETLRSLYRARISHEVSVEEFAKLGS